MDYNGESYTVKVTIGVKGGDYYYDHSLTEVEKGKLLDMIESNQAVSRKGFTPTGDAPIPSYALSRVKDTKLISILQTNSSKIVDENGEPKVVWHGGQFAMSNFVPRNNMHFGTKRAALERILDQEIGYDDVGVAKGSDGRYKWKYTNPYEEDGATDAHSEQSFATEVEAYEDAVSFLVKDVVVKPYFLNIRNIEKTSDAGSDWSDTIDMAKKDGYDGISYENWYEDKGSDSYIAFEPNQIKSAETVTYDDNGNVITLSERFNDDKSDIRFRFTEEEQGIIDKSKADGTWMKAPNGEPTNLNEKQWVMVRTKAFKKWFGDWEKAFRVAKLRSSENASIEGEEISKGEITKKEALEYGKKLQGVYINKDTGNEVQLQRGRKNGGVNEVLQHNYKDQEHLQSVAAIPQIIEKSIYISSEDNFDKKKNPNVVEYQHYVCGLQIGGVNYTVHSLIAVNSNGDRYYDHNHTRIEKKELLDLIKDQAVNVEDFGTTPDTESTILSSYKGKKLISILQTNSSKIVDENGEPMPLKHRTFDGFNVFDKEKIGSNTDSGAFGTGFYFAKRDYILYGNKTMEVFVNMKKPLRLDNSNAYEVKSKFFKDGVSNQDAAQAMKA